ncbi:unnamed protein product [Prorocentrum cordatum]|uniref:Uncharacterized protein n=1 Tax=Prorocentrum cordatum TaxID=2364126 RepID=A0ABN9R0J9_9DINO|nr:unnamed protein product [Polarella glacialis]
MPNVPKNKVIIGKMLSYLHGILSDSPNRTCVFIGKDLNGGLHRTNTLEDDDDATIGMHAHGQQHYAGEAFFSHTCMKDYALCATNTHHPRGPTLTNFADTSYIDYLPPIDVDCTVACDKPQTTPQWDYTRIFLAWNDGRVLDWAKQLRDDIEMDMWRTGQKARSPSDVAAQLADKSDVDCATCEMSSIFTNSNRLTKQDWKQRSGELADALLATVRTLASDATSIYLTLDPPFRPGPKIWHCLALKFTGTNVDLSVRKYADDLTKTHMCHDTQMAAYRAQHSDQILHDKLSAIGDDCELTFATTGELQARVNSLPSAGEHAGAAAAAAAQPARKHRRRQQRERGDQQSGSKSKLVDVGPLELEEMDMKDIQVMFPAVMKLLVNAAMGQRQTDAILIKTYLVSPSTRSAAAIRARVRAWVEKAEDIRSSTAAPQIDVEMAKTGAIRTAAFAGLLEGLHQEGASVGCLNRQNLTTLGNKLKVMDIKQNVELAPLANASDTHDAAQCKLQINLNPRSDVDPSAIHDSLIQTGARRKPGQGPMVHMERLRAHRLREILVAFVAGSLSVVAMLSAVQRAGSRWRCLQRRAEAVRVSLYNTVPEPVITAVQCVSNATRSFSRTSEFGHARYLALSTEDQDEGWFQGPAE